MPSQFLPAVFTDPGLPAVSTSTTLSWVRRYSKDFSTLSNQDLTSVPTFDTSWTAGHTSAANPFDLVNGSGIRMKANDGTNWTDSSDWTGPYVYAKVSDLIGSYGRHDWLSIIVEHTMDSTALFSGSQIVDTMLNYGTSGTGLQNYRNETRAYISTAYNGSGHVRTFGGTQTGGAGVARGSFSTVLELQIRGGIVRNFFGTTFPSGPNLLTPNPTTPENKGIENNDPSSGPVYNPSTDVVAFSMYNYNGAARTVTWKKLEIWTIDMSAVD